MHLRCCLHYLCLNICGNVLISIIRDLEISIKTQKIRISVSAKQRSKLSGMQAASYYLPVIVPMLLTNSKVLNEGRSSVWSHLPVN